MVGRVKKLFLFISRLLKQGTIFEAPTEIVNVHYTFLSFKIYL